MSALEIAAAAGSPASLADGDTGLVVGILVVSLVALGFAGLFAREVLAEGQGTPKMIEIAKAVQEGAAAYLRRQFTTLAAFAALVFLLLFLLPAETGGVRVGRSVFFLVGAGFSALVGFIGMTLATRTNLRVAHAANSAGTRKALRIAFRAGGVVGMFTVGLGLLGASVVLLGFDENAPDVLEGFALRRRPARDVHARRRRHLHQGGRRRRRPRRQGRAGHPGGRPAQRRDDRRQRRRQRRGLRRDGRGPVRVLRRDARRGAHPGPGRPRLLRAWSSR